MSDYFIFTVASFSAIVFVAVVKICFASKCDSVNLCYGLCQIHRAVNLEMSQIPNQSSVEIGNFSPQKMFLQKVLSFNKNHEEISDINYAKIKQMKNERTLVPEFPSEEHKIPV
jgi:hypothetical protein